MTTFKPARTVGARVRVLLCLVSVVLLALLPVVHHHQAPSKAAPAGQSDQSCTLCAVFAGMAVDGSIPSIATPTLIPSLLVQSSGLLVFEVADLCVDGRAPPRQLV